MRCKARLEAWTWHQQVILVIALEFHSREIDENSRLLGVIQKQLEVIDEVLATSRAMTQLAMAKKLFNTRMSKDSRRKKKKIARKRLELYDKKRNFFSSRPKAKLQNILSRHRISVSFMKIIISWDCWNVEQTWANVVAFQLLQPDCVSRYYEMSLTSLPWLPQQPQFFVVRAKISQQSSKHKLINFFFPCKFAF